MGLKRFIKNDARLVLIVCIAFLTMIVVSVLSASRIVSEQTMIIGEEVIARNDMAVEAILSQSTLAFEEIWRNTQHMYLKGEENPAILDYLEQMNDFYGSESSGLASFMKIYAFLAGEFLDGSRWAPPAGYIPQSRPWYLGAANTSKTFFTQPYTDADTGNICLSFSKAILNPNNTLAGVIAIDLDLSQIVEYTSSIRLGGAGYGVLLSDDLTIVEHQKRLYLEEKFYNLGGECQKLSQSLLAGEKVSAYSFQDYNGVNSIAFFHLIMGKWYLGVIVPSTAYYSEVYNLVGLLTILGIFLMTLLSFIILRIQHAKNQSDAENRSKSAFLSRMSHEMRTPMNAIIGMSEIAMKSQSQTQINHSLNTIHEASTHLLGLINDILDMSKIEAGKLDIIYEDTLLSDVIDRSASFIAYKVAEKKQDFSVIIDNNVPKVILADPLYLSQVLTNLLSNACKFTPEKGKITFTVNLVSYNDGIHTLYFSVKDNGIGISDAQRARLFESFEQADAGISRKYGGTGLGLAITKKIIELMGGTIGLESQSGKGSDFYFTLPVQEGKSLPADDDAGSSLAPVPEYDEATTFAGLKLLVAEDVAVNREVLQAQLDGTGIDITFAENGKRAWEKFVAAAGDFDVIFMDIQMPEMDGFEATRAIRQLSFANAQKIPIIAMTANVFREDIERCLAAGMNAHLGKPLDMDAVFSTLARFIEKVYK